MKRKLIIVLLAVCIAILPIVVIAQPRYDADIDLKASVNGSDVKTDKDFIYLYNGDTIDISLFLKTNEDYYAGPFATEILFSGGVQYNSFNWNTSSRFYSCCKTYSNLALKSASGNKEAHLKIDMIPTSADCSVAPSSLNESVVNMRFIAKGKNNDIGSIYLSDKSIRNTSNPFGETYLACYTDNGKLDGKRYDYGEAINFDLTNADIGIKITNAGDTNSDGNITSGDALNILQYSTGILSLSSEKLEAADTDRNGKINSSDSLAVLQIVTGLTTINDILNR